MQCHTCRSGVSGGGTATTRIQRRPVKVLGEEGVERRHRGTWREEVTNWRPVNNIQHSHLHENKFSENRQSEIRGSDNHPCICESILS